MMQRIVPAVVGLLIALFVLMSCVFVVDQRQFAVVYALGEIRKVIDAPGLYFKLPPPFQNVVYYDKRISRSTPPRAIASSRRRSST